MNNAHNPIAEGGDKEPKHTENDYLTISAFDSFLLGMVGFVLFGILLWFITTP